MTRYYFIIAVLLIYLHSTNAEASFSHDVEKVKDHLRREVILDGTLDVGLNKFLYPSGKRPDFLCDKLKNREKQLLCDQIVLNLIDKHQKLEFESLAGKGPQMVGPGNSHKCEEKSIEKLNMKKDMLWCGSRLFNKKDSKDYGELQGFFCAESRKTDGRVFVFRSVEGNEEVTPIGELDHCDLILGHMPHHKHLSGPGSSSHVSSWQVRQNFTWKE